MHFPGTHGLAAAVKAEWSSIPIAVPIAIVIPKPIANVTIFGCVTTAFMILFFTDISKIAIVPKYIRLAEDQF
jgi:hypothetical protein